MLIVSQNRRAQRRDYLIEHLCGDEQMLRGHSERCFELYLERGLIVDPSGPHLVYAINTAKALCAYHTKVSLDRWPLPEHLREHLRAQGEAALASDKGCADLGFAFEALDALLEGAPLPPTPPIGPIGPSGRLSALAAEHALS